MRVTVVGARGFVGAAVARAAAARGHDVAEVAHDRLPAGPLGTVVYCSGIAWDAQQRKAEAYRLHVDVPLRIVLEQRFDRFVYLSSTRVYDWAESSTETASIVVPAAGRDVYVASKFAGEMGVLDACERTVVARLSNVAGASTRSKLFLSDIVRQAVATGKIELRSALASSKDYVLVEDAAKAIVLLAEGAKERIYNVAAGANTTHDALLAAIAGVWPVEVGVQAGSPVATVPRIDVSRLRDEFDFRPSDVVAAIPRIVEAFARAVRRERSS